MMELIIRGRDRGKTTTLINRAHKDHLLIVVPYRIMVRQVVIRARELHLSIIDPMCSDDMKFGKFRGRVFKGFLLDDANKFPPGFISDIQIYGPVIACAMTLEDNQTLLVDRWEVKNES